MRQRSVTTDRFWRQSQIQLTSAQVLVVPVRPPSLTLNHTALLSKISHGTQTHFRRVLHLRSAGLPCLTTSIGASRHVGDHGTDVRVGPESPSQGDGRSRSSSSVQGRGCRTRDAAGCVSSALDIDQVNALDGAVALDRARDSLGLLEICVSCGILALGHKARLTVGLVYGSW